MLNSKLLILWYTNIKTFSALKFILDSPYNHEAYVTAVLTEITERTGRLDHENDHKYHRLIESDPGQDYEIYRSIISDRPQPIPELKNYNEDIQKEYGLHPCWVGWAGIFDRKLTKEERVILSYYRKAFLHLLIDGKQNEAYAIMALAECPFNDDLLTGELLYSVNVLRGTLAPPQN
jgi:hypothetical protein